MPNSRSYKGLWSFKLSLFTMMHRLFISIGLLLCALSMQAQEDSLATDSTATTADTLLATKGDSIVSYAKSLLGTTYQYGQCTPGKGFDCSGFVYHVFKSNGIKSPRTSVGFGRHGIEVPLDSARKGDVMVFTGTDYTKRSPGHVGIVVTNPGEPLQFMHSSSSKKHYGVVVTNYHNSGYPKRFLKVMRVID